MEFREALFGCEKTPGLFFFLVSFFCLGSPCCVQGKIVSDMSQKNLFLHCALPCFCLCIGGAYNRQIIKKEIGVESNFYRDLLLHFLCNPCAVNQEFLETHARGYRGKLHILFKTSDRPDRQSFTPLAPIDNPV